MQDIIIAGVGSLGVILFLTAIADLVLLKTKLSSAIAMGLKKVPVVGGFINPMLVLITIGLIGVLMGGLAGTASAIGMGGSDERVDEKIIGSQCALESVEYSSIVASAGFDTANFTFTADTADKSNYFIDASNSSSVANATIELSGNWTLKLKDAPATGKECTMKVYAVSPSFKDENSVGASANDIYDLVNTARSVSDLQGIQYGNRVSAVQFEENIWVEENTQSITGSGMDKELTSLSFTAGESDTKLGYTIDLESTAYAHINKGSQFKVYFLRQVGDKPSANDPVVATLTLRKGAIT